MCCTRFEIRRMKPVDRRAPMKAATTLMAALVVRSLVRVSSIDSVTVSFAPLEMPRM